MPSLNEDNFESLPFNVIHNSTHIPSEENWPIYKLLEENWDVCRFKLDLDSKLRRIFVDNIDIFSQEISLRSLENFSRFSTSFFCPLVNKKIEMIAEKLISLILNDSITWGETVLNWLLNIIDTTVPSSSLQFTQSKFIEISQQKEIWMKCVPIAKIVEMIIIILETHPKDVNIFFKVYEKTGKSSPSLDWLFFVIVQKLGQKPCTRQVLEYILSWFVKEACENGLNSNSNIYEVCRILEYEQEAVRIIVKSLCQFLLHKSNERKINGNPSNRKEFHDCLSICFHLCSHHSSFLNSFLKSCENITEISSFMITYLDHTDIQFFHTQLSQIFHCSRALSGIQSLTFLRFLINPIGVGSTASSNDDPQPELVLKHQSLSELAIRLQECLLSDLESTSLLASMSQENHNIHLSIQFHTQELLNNLILPFNTSSDSIVNMSLRFFSILLECSLKFGIASCIDLIIQLLKFPNNFDVVSALLMHSAEFFQNNLGRSLLKNSLFEFISGFDNGFYSENQFISLIKNCSYIISVEANLDSVKRHLTSACSLSVFRMLTSIHSMQENVVEELLNLITTSFNLLDCYFSLSEFDEVDLWNILYRIFHRFMKSMESIGQSTIQLSDLYKTVIVSLISININLQKNMIEELVTFCFSSKNRWFFTDSVNIKPSNALQCPSENILDHIHPQKVFNRSYFHTRTQQSQFCRMIDTNSLNTESDEEKQFIRSNELYKLMNMILSSKISVVSITAASGSTVLTPINSKSEHLENSASANLQAAAACISMAMILDMKVSDIFSISFLSWPHEDVIPKAMKSFIQIDRLLDEVPVVVLFINTIAPIRPALSYCQNLILSNFAVVMTKWEQIEPSTEICLKQPNIVSLLHKTERLLKWISLAGWIPSKWAIIIQMLPLLHSEDLHCILKSLWIFLRCEKIAAQHFFTSTDDQNHPILRLNFSQTSQNNVIHVLKSIMINDLVKFRSFYPKFLQQMNTSNP